MRRHSSYKILKTSDFYDVYFSILYILEKDESIQFNIMKEINILGKKSVPLLSQDYCDSNIGEHPALDLQSHVHYWQQHKKMILETFQDHSHVITDGYLKGYVLSFSSTKRRSWWCNPCGTKVYASITKPFF